MGQWCHTAVIATSLFSIRGNCNLIGRSTHFFDCGPRRSSHSSRKAFPTKDTISVNCADPASLLPSAPTSIITRRSLGHLLMTNVRRGKIPARVLLDVLPALNEFGYWERLPGSLRRSIWRLASEDMRQTCEMVATTLMLLDFFSGDLHF